MGRGDGSYHMPRTCHIVLLVLQLISTFERQIFDFMGYMWLPILANFLNIIFVIFGLFAVYQYSARYMLAYSVWTLVWLAYNVFIICYYLDVGDLDKKDDILSFGAGSFSWWLVNSPGCRPVYNTTFIDEASASLPPRPTSVEDCSVRYEQIEVTHAAIQLVISTLGLIMSVFLIHYFLVIVKQKREKQGVKSMYSIEYSPQYGGDSSNPNTLERETDLQNDAVGDARGQQQGAMTPRRVKRRSYRNSTRNSKNLNRQSNRQSGRSARSSGRSHKSINPVTRLIDADQNRADSSTSNDAERYGQINPGFQVDNSRPNSIYNLSGPPTDIEASRPQSALTSYSNFHGQRRPAANNSLAATAVGRPNVTNLTQESLLNHENHMNSSFDDLPPPPPPLSSSPTPPDGDQVSDSDNTSSVATAQMPVPLQRSSIRRNEYVNIPIPTKGSSPIPAIVSHQEPEPQSPVGNGHHQHQPPPRHNYANLNGPTANVNGQPQHHNSGQQQQHHNGARPRTTNPLFSQKSAFDFDRTYSEMDRTVGPVVTYEAETLRADTKLHQPGLYNEPYSISEVPSQRSSQSEPYPPSPRDLYITPSEHNGYGQKPLPQSPRTGGERYQSNDPLRYPPPPPQSGGGYPGEGEPPSLQSLSSDFSSHNSQKELLRRIPNGHAARDRVSLRAKQKRDMEQRAAKQVTANSSSNNNRGMMGGYANALPTEEYGFAGLSNGYANGPSSMPNTNGQPANGYADMSGKRTPEDKWYLKDSMRPVGAASHGLHCKCYRCQRKLTAI